MRRSQNLLLVSSNASFLKEIESLIGDLDYSLRLLQSSEEIKCLDITYNTPLAIIESNGNESWLMEVIAAIRSKLKSSAILVTFTHATVLNFTELKASSKMILIQRPFEDETFMSTLLDLAPIEVPLEKLKIEHLYPVRISDLDSEIEFDFDIFIYLNANKKILLYSGKNSKLTAKQVQNFKDHNVQNLYVRRTDKLAFHHFIKSKLNETSNGKFTSDAARREEMKQKIKELFVGFFDSSHFDYDRSQEVLKAGKKVIGKFILETEPMVDIFEQTRAPTRDFANNYDHATNVSIFSTMFAIALSLPDVGAATIGGLLHDIGLSLLPVEFYKLPFDSLTAAQKSIYCTHPMSGAGYLRNKNLAAADIVYSIIQQHHENFDGTGYPLGIKGEEIHILARLCQIADQFDYLLNGNSEGEKLSPKEIFNIMVKANQTKTSIKYDQVLLEKLQRTFESSLFQNMDKNNLDTFIESPDPLAPETAQDRAMRKARGGKPWRFVK